MGTAKTLPPNTSLILQAMANSLQTGTLLRLADSDIEVKIKASITRFTLSWTFYNTLVFHQTLRNLNVGQITFNDM